jgi:hypothetical protein
MKMAINTGNAVNWYVQMVYAHFFISRIVSFSHSDQGSASYKNTEKV